MAILPILVAPDPRLKQVARPVERVDDELLSFLDDMLDTMYAAKGLGLAAPQVGVLKRVVVLDPARDEEEPCPLRLINPEILWSSEDLTSYREGCLSVPEQFDDVVRPARVAVRYTDETNSVCEIEAEGLLAVILQHEIDHLNGVLFVDYLSALKRGIMLRRVRKARRQTGDAA
ncbi:peptide deformylase [Phaeovibrio sulfidiphilus]|uniref:Peptide deformylase n=1 Tax=Phaeovibrio sulfidiphilus TaxID=1220600 RepID=A0A8J7CCD4_9PROT|nr:peptide deformylase [Phaeovibrio sulfidiphilus]MBE1237158.1 peptide deformylase [Phaeovibrio sulfidiphilus]